MTALDPRALDHAISEFIRTFDPWRPAGDPETDRSDYASAVGEALEGAIGVYLQETGLAAVPAREPKPEPAGYAPVTRADFLGGVVARYEP